MTTLVLPDPELTKGRFASIPAYSDEALYVATGVRIAFTTREGGVSEGRPCQCPGEPPPRSAGFRMRRCAPVCSESSSR